MSFSVAFTLPAYNSPVGAGVNPFTQSGPTLDLIFAGVTQPNNTFVGASLKLNFLTQVYQYPAQYSVWVNDVGLTAKTFSDIVTFTRASSATYVNTLGYIASAATDVPRFDYDSLTLSSLGFLLEDTRTNLLPYANDFASFWTYSANINSASITSPDGSATSLFLDPTGAGEVDLYYSLTKAATSKQYTASIWVRTNDGATISSLSLSLDDGTTTNRGVAVFTISSPSSGSLVSTASQGTFSGTLAGIKQYKDGWFRITLTTTSDSGTNIRFRCFYTAAAANLPALFVWGAQLEESAFVTSFIYTNGAAVTRAADVASVNTLSPWYNPLAGTLYTEALLESPPSLNSNQLSAVSDGTNSNRIQLGANTLYGGNLNFMVTTAGVTQASVRVSPLTTVGPYKTAGAYITDNFQLAVNGVLSAEDTSGAVPSGLTTLQIGAAANPSTKGNLWLRRITYYGRQLPNYELVGITT